MFALLPAVITGYMAWPAWEEEDPDAPWPWYGWLLISLPLLAAIVAVAAIRSGVFGEKSVLGRWVVALERVARDFVKSITTIVGTVTAPLFELLRSVASVIPGVS